MFTMTSDYYVLYSTSGYGKFATEAGGESEKIQQAKSFDSKNEASNFRNTHPRLSSFTIEEVSAKYNLSL